ncbi:MAG: hypothetical protein FVQ83_00490 [Chloroflexi bacterium]|nr:hypothetical protein [Chloroflexota bacterium]
MPSIKTQVNCPNCRQPIVADIEQLFDVGVDPQAKQRLLSGQFNLAGCPHCGFNGTLSSPILYHDPVKELLLSFFPPELNLSRDDQERAIGPLLNKVVDNLPQEQRKGYLFNPQSVLTLQGLIERILQEDGITKDVIEGQQKRVDLMQRMLSLSEEELTKVAKKEDELIDEDFFRLLGHLGESSLQSGDQDSAKKLSELQQKLLPITTFGGELQAQTKEIEAAVKSLQDAGEKLTREKLLEIILDAPNEIRLNALVGMARGGMDYEFFQMLTNRIEAAEGDEKQRLTDLREKLLDMTRALDEQVAARLAQANQNLESVLASENIETALIQNLQAIDDYFIQAVNNQYETALKAEDKEKQNKLLEVIEVIQKAQQAASPGSALLKELMEAPDEPTINKILEANKQEISPAFIDSLTQLLVQLEAGEDKESTDKVRKIYRAAVRFSMQSGMKS